ncbi:hypothetical protein GCM10009133_24920 [Cocleimonas flava]|uniref:Nuclease-like protein n=1 Tax=Cocleimonas flava TaxID=634765 RepID=A0A4R1EP19_9GAMM|nr:nuclease-related domain-containing protein [Cocleimonas flava]TCJ83026.1 nuclease-like protein [Cocleimonas flava]
MFIFVFLIIVILLIVVIQLQSPTLKGKIGESIVNRAINKKLNKAQYHLIKDITIPVLDHTTQIDHVIVSRYGIFVIETKNMKGWIFGGERQKIWTQSLLGKKFKFQNSLHQNYKHIKALAHMLELTDDKFHSVIVFTGESTFKTQMPENVLDKGYIDYIKSKKEVIFSISEVYEFIEKIELLELERSRETNKNHIAYLKMHHKT